MRNASGHRGETEQQLKKANRNTYDNSSIKRITKFHPVVVQNNGKEMYKKVCGTWKVFFWASWPETTVIKIKNKKLATCFPTLVQNKFISDVESFTTDVETHLLQGGEMRSIAIQLVLQQCCKKKNVLFLLPVLPYLLIFCRRRLTLHNFFLLLFFLK